MRRLALAAALPLLAACPTSPCPEPAMEVRWNPQDLDGAGGGSCTGLGVATMDVIVDAVRVRTGVACSAGVSTLDPPAAGAHRVTVEGRDANGFLVVRDWYDAVAECGLTTHAATPGLGTLFLAYGTSTNLCLAAGDESGLASYLWFRVKDVAYDATWFLVDQTSAPEAMRTYQCGPYGSQPATYRPIRLDLPYGVYRLTGMQVVKDPTTAPAVQYQVCAPTDVTLHGAGETLREVLLSPPTEVCAP